MTTRPTALRASVVALVLLAVGLAWAPSASAAAFRYWTYWQGEGSTWAFATQGPATSLPADGSVEGWRFAVTTQARSGEETPSVAPDFATICKDTPATASKKRVALIVDAGPAAIAPSGQQPPTTVATCVVADPDATGFAVLQSVVPVQTDQGLICSLGGYPQGECAPILDDAEAQRVAQAQAAAPSTAAQPSAPASSAPAAPPADSGSPWATIAVAVLLIGGAAFWMAVRRHSSSARDVAADDHG